MADEHKDEHEKKHDSPWVGRIFRMTILAFGLYAVYLEAGPWTAVTLLYIYWGVEAAHARIRMTDEVLLLTAQHTRALLRRANKERDAKAALDDLLQTLRAMGAHKTKENA